VGSEWEGRRGNTTPSTHRPITKHHPGRKDYKHTEIVRTKADNPQIQRQATTLAQVDPEGLNSPRRITPPSVQPSDIPSRDVLCVF
jgi:hypothetical protein